MELAPSSPFHPQFHCPLDARVFLQNLFSNLNAHSNHLGICYNAGLELASRDGLQQWPLFSVRPLHDDLIRPPCVAPLRST